METYGFHLEKWGVHLESLRKNGISPPKLVIEYDSIMVSRDASVDLCREIVGYDQQLH